MFDYITNRDGKKLFAVIDYPKGKGPFGAVLIIHGFKGSSAQRHIRGISDVLVDAGFLTIRPDLTKNPGKSYLEFSDMTFQQALEDCHDLVDYLLKMDGVDKSRVGICGHSLAGMIAAEIAARRKEIKALAILSGVYDFKLIANKIFKKPIERAKKDFGQKGFTTVWSTDLQKRLRINKNFWQDAFARSAQKFTKSIKCPTLVVSSGSDESVGQSHADKYLETIGARDKKMEIIKGADHNYSGENLGKVCKIVAKWFFEKISLKTENS